MNPFARWRSSELGWLIGRARPFRELYAAQLTLVFLASVLALVDPLLIKWLIDGVLVWGRSDMLPVVAISFFAIYCFQYGFTALGMVLDVNIRQRLMLRLRLSLLGHLHHQDGAFFRQHADGDLLARLEGDVEQVCELGGHSLAALVRLVVTTGLTLIVMLALSWRLTLSILPLIPLLWWLRGLAEPLLRRANDRCQAVLAERLGCVGEQLQNIEQVQLLGRGRAERWRYLRVARGALDALISRRTREAGLDLTTQLAMVAGSAIVLGFGGAQVMAGRMTIGGLVAFLTYLARIFGPAQTVVMIYASFQRSAAGIRRLRQILDLPPSPPEARGAKKVSSRGALDVQFEGIRFAYECDSLGRSQDTVSESVGGERVPILDGLNLRLEASQRIALVGASGCGKSTLLRLLTRIHTPDHGLIRLGGIDIRELAVRDLRRAVAFVPQESMVLQTTLRHNLAIAAPRSSLAELEAALELAELGDLPGRLARGWDSPLRSATLSGGEKQRLALARAILRDPQVLLLDEATSALDGSTERRLLEGLEPFFGSRTVVMVAHRLSTIRWAERVVVLEGGRVVAAGAHAELFSENETYRRLCHDQLREGAARNSEKQDWRVAS